MTLTILIERDLSRFPEHPIKALLMVRRGVEAAVGIGVCVESALTDLFTTGPANRAAQELQTEAGSR